MEIDETDRVKSSIIRIIFSAFNLMVENMD